MADGLTQITQGIDLTSPTKMFTTVNWYGIINKFIIVLFVVVIFYFLLKLAMHKRLVKIYEKVRDGYVIRSQRYSLAYDKENNLEYLRPMFGKQRMPNFKNTNWQKVNGFPFFGITRVINVIKEDEHSYKVLLPPVEQERTLKGIVRYENTLNWVYLEQFRQFLKKRLSKNIWTFLAIAAPSIIIISTIGFFAYVIWQHHNQVLLETEAIKRGTDALIQWCAKPP